MSLVIFEISLMQTCLAICVIYDAAVAITFALTVTKFNLPAATLQIQWNSNLLQQLKFRRTINWNICQ